MIYAGVQKNVGPASMVIVMGICLGTTLPGNDRNSGKGRNTAALPSLYWFPVGPFRHIGAIRAGSGKLQKMVKRIPSFLHSTDAETVPFHEKRSYSKYNF